MQRFFEQVEYYAKRFLEIELNSLFPQPSRRGRRGKSKAMDAKKQRRSFRKSVNLFRRVLQANFTEHDDLVCLGYKKQPSSIEEAQLNMRNFERRLKRLYQKRRLPEVKYVTVMERGKRNDGLHFHVVVSRGLNKEDLDRLWGNKFGATKIEKLRLDKHGLADLAQYLSKAPAGKRRWNGSHNLEKPVVQHAKEYYNRREVKKIVHDATYWEKKFPGYTFVESDVYENEVNHGLYALVRLYKEDIQ